MATYAQRLYHIVYGTKNRKPVLIAAERRRLFGYLHGIIRNLDCHLYRLNGTEDHIHMLVDIHPSVSLADFIRETKADSSRWRRENGIMPRFEYWQEGYGAFTKSWADKDMVIEYIKGQEEHHRKETFLEEFRRLVEEAGMEWDDRFLP